MRVMRESKRRKMNSSRLPRENSKVLKQLLTSRNSKLEGFLESFTIFSPYKRGREGAVIEQEITHSTL